MHGDQLSMTTLKLGDTSHLQLLDEFYCMNDHPFVAYRPQLMGPLLARRNFVLAQHQQEIVAAGAFERFTLQGGYTRVELIQGRVLRAGSGVYRLLIACRLLTTINRYGFEHIFCEIDEINTRARNIYRSMGFVEFQPSKELYRVSIAELPSSKRPESLGYGFAWYQITAPAIHNVLAALRMAVLSDDYSAFVAPKRLIVLDEPLREMALNAATSC